MQARIKLSLYVILIAVFVSGCTAPPHSAEYGASPAMTPPRTNGSVTVTFYRAPVWDWTAEQVLPYVAVNSYLERDLGQRTTLDDAAYVPVPLDVADWAWYQIDSARNEGVTQVIDYLIRAYGTDPDTRAYDQYIAEAHDCDDYAETYARIARLIIGIRYGIHNATPAIFVIHVEQAHAWGGVPAGGLHALCAEISPAKTTRVREPQGGISGPADQYPNHTIRVYGHVVPVPMPGRQHLRQLAALLPPESTPCGPIGLLHRITHTGAHTGPCAIHSQ